MVYKTFLETIMQQLQEKLDPDCQIALRPLQKNNGVVLDGLSIQTPDIETAPTIYINPYYTQYLHGMTLDAILSDILKLLRSTVPSACPSISDLLCLDHLRSKVMFRLIHTASNKALLEDVPSIPYLDLSIVFYLFLERNEIGQMTALIHKEHAQRWNLSAHDLWNLALENTQRDFPAEIRSMTDMMKEIAKENMGDAYDEEFIHTLLEDEEHTAPIYVLSNQVGLNGAACILYEDVLKDFADFLNRDLIILPSSIHEVLIAPDISESAYEELSSMVTCINRRDVPLEDQLSNQVYLYTRSDRQIRIMTQASPCVGAAALH